MNEERYRVIVEKNNDVILSADFSDLAEALDSYESVRLFNLSFTSGCSVVLLKENWRRISTTPLQREDY